MVGLGCVSGKSSAPGVGGLDSPLKGAVIWGPGSGKNRGEVGREEQVEGTAGTEARRREGAGTPPPPP